MSFRQQRRNCLEPRRNHYTGLSRLGENLLVALRARQFVFDNRLTYSNIRRNNRIDTDYSSDLKYAALTARETYYIQCWVLCQAKGIPPILPLPISRPRRYLHPTLESQLPCCFPAVTVSLDDLGRPDLLCAFCPHIKAYASITGESFSCSSV